MSKLLINEPPLQVLPSLASAIGLNEAIVVQQLHYLLLDPNHGRRVAEHRWIFNTVEEWKCRYFPFWSIRTIKTIFTNLATLGLVVSCQPEGRISRRKYYRIDTVRMEQIADGAKFVPSIVQESSHGNVQNSSLPITKTTAKTPLQRKVRAHASVRHRPFSEWEPKFPYPDTEGEMYDTLEAHGIDSAPDYDGSFFDVMTRSGWRINDKPIWDWIATYAARLEVTLPGSR